MGNETWAPQDDAWASGNDEFIPVDKTVVSNIPIMTKVEDTAPQRRVSAGSARPSAAGASAAVDPYASVDPYALVDPYTTSDPYAYAKSDYHADPFAPVSPYNQAGSRGQAPVGQDSRRAVPASTRTQHQAAAPCPQRRGASAPRWIVRLLCLGLLIFGALTVYYLTEQTVDQTSSLSSSAGDFVEKGAWIVESGQLPAFEDDPIKWAGCVVLLISQKFVRHGLEVRQQAHVVEFALLGGVIALNVLAWMSGWAHRRDERGRIHGWRTLLMYMLSVGLCAAASFADQYHKLYVPGRHFDKFDLILDASGYLTAVTCVFIAWSVGSALYRLVFRK